MPGSKLLVCFPLLCSFAFVAVDGALAQDASLPDAPTPQTSTQTLPPELGGPRKHKPSSNHIFWVIPNYRSDEDPADIKPLTAGQKFKLAFDDSFDPSSFLVAATFAGISMAQGQHRAFDDGFGAGSKYFAAAFADQAIGNYMTEAIFPTVLHQDPRYHVMGRGGFFKRTGYALSREVITRGDDGKNHFNTSELAGNGVAAGISNLYYPDADRSLGNTGYKWGEQVGLDAFFNVLKEFWPDVRGRLFSQ